MVGDEFWQLIERTRPPEPDPEVHAWKITRALVDGGASRTVAFGHAFDEALDALESWDLWGAGHLLLGGLSDDGFAYLRGWIVGQGPKAWDAARTDPETFAIGVLAGIDDAQELYEHLVDIGLDDGEHLLHAAGIAHEELTGEWLPPHPARATSGGDGGGDGGDAGPFAGPRPVGVPWEEDDLPERFSRLHAALPAGWVGTDPGLATAFDRRGGGADGVDGVDEAIATFERASVLQRALEEADEAWGQGEHARVVAALAPVLDHEPTWAMVRQFGDVEISQTIAYQGAMSRLIGGDPEGAVVWFRLVGDDPDLSPTFRRGLAQVELSLGGLDACERLLEIGPGADSADLAIATLVAGRRGDHDLVIERGRLAFDAMQRAAGSKHPWDLAGMNLLVGSALVEVGEGEKAMVAVRNALDLVDDAPPELPLVPQALVVGAGAYRLLGDLDAADRALSDAWDRFEADTADFGLAQREVARCYRAAGQLETATARYQEAIATFQAAGERGLAASTEQEAGSHC